MRSASARRICSRLRARPSSYVWSDMLPRWSRKGGSRRSAWPFQDTGGCVGKLEEYRPHASNRRARPPSHHTPRREACIGGASLDPHSAPGEHAVYSVMRLPADSRMRSAGRSHYPCARRRVLSTLICCASRSAPARCTSSAMATAARRSCCCTASARRASSGATSPRRSRSRTERRSPSTCSATASRTGRSMPTSASRRRRSSSIAR